MTASQNICSESDFRNNCFCLSYFVLVIHHDLEWQNRLFLQISFNKSFLSSNNIYIYIYVSNWEWCSESCSKTFLLILYLCHICIPTPVCFGEVPEYMPVFVYSSFISFSFFFFFFYLHPEWMNVLHSLWMSAETSFLPLKQSKTFPFPRLFSFKYCDRSLMVQISNPTKTSKNTYKQRICPQVFLQSVVGSRLNLSVIRAVFLWLS